ncbi:MAG TPA: 16S rRNA (uracil(1498)-N(3))-methyltransferase, partial [Caulobacterales bacterium]|nr:16S rRNA (uracil(1498)-N(3))-methyltransferase [Caulobacterales bacterium]
MPDPRLYVEDDLSAGAIVALNDNQARYLSQVLRLGEHGKVRVFNGRDGEWSAEIARAGKRGLALSVGAQTREQADASGLHLLFSPLKRHATDWLIEKSTELGVGVLAPVIAKRTVAETVRVDRLSAIAREAAEQTERLSVPAVHEPVALDDLLQTWPSDRRLLLADEAGGGAPLAEALTRLDQTARRAPWAVLVGPEGGFARAELDALRKLPFVTAVGLG